MINSFLVVAHGLGALALIVACLRHLEHRKDASFGLRLSLLAIVIVSLMATIDTAASRLPMRPWSVLLVVIIGFVALGRTYGVGITGLRPLQWPSREQREAQSQPKAAA